LDCEAARDNGRAFAERILAHDFGMARERYPNEPGGRLLIDAWMSLNECLVGPMSGEWKEGTDEERQKLRAKATAFDCFQVGFRERLSEEGLEAVAFNFGAGNFQTGESYLSWFPRTLESYVYLGFHEYGWPTLMADPEQSSVTLATTYREVMEELRQQYGDRHKVIITEAGLARMLKYPQDDDVGWLNTVDPISQEQYWASLEWYNQELIRDGYVMGACLFAVGHRPMWETFRHLGVDNDGQPLTIISRIADLRW
jgi:hypothetical protein